MKLRKFLLSTVVATCPVVPAMAQHGKPVPLKTASTNATKDRAATSSRTTSKDARTAAVTATRSETIHVSADVDPGTGVSNKTPGGGLMAVQTVARSQSSLSRDFIAKAAPTTNITNLVSMLPGAISANQDPLGITGDDTLNMRGMNIAQIGYLFEGAPIASPNTYIPYTAMMVDTENLGGVTVSQGSPAIDAPVYNAVGGEVSAVERNPGHRFGAFFDLMGGTHSANKDFFRVDTGDIGKTGLRGFVSFSYTSSNSWRGPGDTKRFHVDAKFIKEWGDGNSIAAIFGFNRQHSTQWMSPTMAQWKEYGISYNDTKNYSFGVTNYYKNALSNLNDIHAIVPMHFNLGHGLKISSTAYWERQNGPTAGGEMIPASGGYFGTEQYGNLNLPYTAFGYADTRVWEKWVQAQEGLTTTLSWKKGFNTLEFGDWYAYSTTTSQSGYSLLDYNGNLVPGYDPIMVDGKQLSGINQNFKQQTNSLFIADTMKFFNNRLQLNAGFRAPMITRWGTNGIPGSNPYERSLSNFEPLPQVGISYFFNHNNQIYVNGTTAFRAVGNPTSYVPQYDPNFSYPFTSPSSVKPEYSIGEEIGFRHHGFYNVAISLFNYNMTNHMLTSTGYIPGTSQLTSTTINAGGQTSRGLQWEFSLARWHHFSPYFSGQYLHATMDSNFNVGTDYLRTAGKIAVSSPTFSTSLGLNYDDGTIFGSFNFRYVSHQYTTLMDDERMPSYTTSDLTLGYRMKKIGAVKSPQIQLNIINIGDNHYLSAPGGYTATAHGAMGINGHEIAGSAPVYLVGAPFTALVSVSMGL